MPRKKKEDNLVLDPPKSLNPFSDYLVQEIEKKEIIEDLFEYKHRPKDFSEFVGNKLQIKVLRKWIKESNFSKQRFCIIHGYHGIGKSVLAKLVLKDYNIILYDSNSTNEKKSFFDNIANVLKTVSIENSLLQKKNSAIIIENFDKNIGEGIYYKKFTELIEKNNSKVPIICLCSSHNIKKKYNTPSKILLIFLDYPEQTDVIDYCLRIMKKENIDMSLIALKWLISSSRYDFRKILQLLKMLSLSSKKKRYTKNDVRKILQFSEANIFYSAVEIIDETFNDSIERDFEELIELCYCDQPLIVDLFYSNLTNCLNILDISTVLDNISRGDVIQNYIYKNQKWDMRDYVIILSCITAIVIIRERKKKKIYKISKNKLNNLPWTCVKNKKVFQEIKNCKKSFFKNDEYRYIFTNILKPQIEKNLDNPEELYKLVEKAENIGIGFTHYIKLRSIGFEKVKVLTKKEKTKLEKAYLKLKD